MARYDHIQLVRLPERFERRKHGGGSPPPNRDLAAHSTKLETELDAATATQQRRRKAEFVDPSLILRVHMSSQLLEEQWEQLGLTVLSSDLDRSLVLFASTDEMQEFRRRLAAWKAGIPEGQKAPPITASSQRSKASALSNLEIASASASVRKVSTNRRILKTTPYTLLTLSSGISASDGCASAS
ncbi:hypothetical protein QA644_34800 (plasmid) [Rhizobium sp. CC1099]|uniref:hypothetical protein n=1 Tax=Rhizobium sp. CC1099 TaxID=3039160 RepID=UPI0024B0A1FE|nr:hypothetical protein [Rhizobium sp. CC1099]WFU92058.1 hypothetical protein QA644_34800 [Rhizobium sp. CC1099]